MSKAKEFVKTTTENLWPPTLESFYQQADFLCHLAYTVLQCKITYALIREGSNFRAPAAAVMALPAICSGLYVAFRLQDTSSRVSTFLLRGETTLAAPIFGFGTAGLGLLFGLHPVVPTLLWGLPIDGQPFDCQSAYDDDDYEQDGIGMQAIWAAGQYAEHSKHLRQAHPVGSPGRRVINRLLSGAVGRRRKTRDPTQDEPETEEEDEGEKENVKKDWLARLDHFVNAKGFVHTAQVPTFFVGALPWLVMLPSIISNGSCGSGSGANPTLPVASLFTTCVYILFRTVPLAIPSFTGRGVMAVVSLVATDISLFIVAALTISEQTVWHTSSSSSIVQNATIAPVSTTRLPFGWSFSIVSSSFCAFCIQSKLYLAVGLFIAGAASLIVATRDRMPLLMFEAIFSNVLAFLLSVATPSGLLTVLSGLNQPFARERALSRLLHQFLFFDAESQKNSDGAGGAAAAAAAVTPLYNWARATDIFRNDITSQVERVVAHARRKHQLLQLFDAQERKSANSASSAANLKLADVESAARSMIVHELLDVQRGTAWVRYVLFNAGVSEDNRNSGNVDDDLKSILAFQKDEKQLEDGQHSVNQLQQHLEEMCRVSPVVDKSLFVFLFLWLQDDLTQATKWLRHWNDHAQQSTAASSPNPPKMKPRPFHSLLTQMILQKKLDTSSSSWETFFTFRGLTASNDVSSFLWRSLVLIEPLRVLFAESWSSVAEQMKKNPFSIAASVGVVAVFAAAFLNGGFALYSVALTFQQQPSNVLLLRQLNHAARQTRFCAAVASVLSMAASAVLFPSLLRELRTASLVSALRREVCKYDGPRGSLSNHPVAAAVAAYETTRPQSMLLGPVFGVPASIPETAMQQHVLAFLTPDMFSVKI